MNTGTKMLDEILTIRSNNIKKVYRDQQRFIPGMHDGLSSADPPANP